MTRWRIIFRLWRCGHSLRMARHYADHLDVVGKSVAQLPPPKMTGAPPDWFKELC